MRAKFVNENMGFKRGVDPRSSMNLGGYSFETLRKGAILQCIKQFSYTKNGNLASFISGSHPISEGQYLVVLDFKYKPDFMDFGGREPNSKGKSVIQFIQMITSDLERVKGFRKDLINGNARLHFWGTKGKMKISELEFKNRLKIIERGES
jgi:hypothetical protein